MMTDDYMELTEKLLEGFPENEEGICKRIFAQRTEIDAINDIVVQTKIYKENIDKSNSFFNEIAGTCHTNQEMIEKAWRHFLIKCIESPTQIHLRGSVIFNIPIVKRFMDLSNKIQAPNHQEQPLETTQSVQPEDAPEPQQKAASVW